jgi:Domain of Unknown Function with PDB structure (DUF3857)/Domain of Unknown Function with PDB structure (DUF3858)
MIRFFFTCLLVVFIGQTVSGNREIKYPVSAIPDSLKINAKAVIRNHEQVFEIKSTGNYVETVTYAITILNENGLPYAIFRQPYDKLSRLTGIKGTVFNALGEKVEQLTNEKVIDYSAISGYALYEDDRIKYFEPRTMTFPFTVEYSYVQDYSGLISYPSWYPLHDYNVSLENSVFSVICPNALSFRYSEKNIPDILSVKKNDLNSTYTWHLQKQMAMEAEPFCPSFFDLFPAVILAPNEFEIEGFKGDCSSWESLGRFDLDLIRGKDNLSPETQQKIRDLVKDIPDDYDKAKAVFNYMQQKTRYVSIQIGIGGWEPFDAATVDRLGYGDCKALANYTRSLLAVAGIKAYYASIYADANPPQLNVGFPDSKFNHAILCLPLQGDTLWLECTSQHKPFGFVGKYIDDRFALVVMENGGKLVRTKVYTAAENRMERNTTLVLDATGNASLKTCALHKGTFYEDKLGILLAGNEDKNKAILDEVSLPGAFLTHFDYHEMQAKETAISESLEFIVPRYATLSGPRLLVPLIPLDRFRDLPKKLNSRKSDVVIRRDVSTCDTIMVVIPENYTAESVPSEIKAESRFGAYSLHSAVNGNKVICIRKMEMKKGQYSPSTYNELTDFLKKVASADNSKISLKATGG